MKPIRIRPHADMEIEAFADYIAHDNPHAALRFTLTFCASYTARGIFPTFSWKVRNFDPAASPALALAALA